MSAPVHFIELYADRGEIAPRLVCTATPDAICRRRPVDPAAESWTEETETTSGHDCWATEWVANGDWESVSWGPGFGTLARVPVDVSFDDGVTAEPVVLPDPADMLPGVENPPASYRSEIQMSSACGSFVGDHAPVKEVPEGSRGNAAVAEFIPPAVAVTP